MTELGRILRGLGALLVVAAAFAPSAVATLRVEMTATGALMITDKNATFDDVVTLRLEDSVGGLDWVVSKTTSCGGACIDVTRYEYGPGCRPEAGAGNRARCLRQAGAVTVNLLGGNDVFTTGGGESHPITDPLTINLGTGDDIASGAEGHDTMQGGSGNDRLDGKAGDDLVQGSIGDDVLSGAAGNDNLTGSDGADQITPGVGADGVDAGAGNDTISLGTPQRDETDDVNGGIGLDKTTYVGRQTLLRIVEANLETLGGEKNAGENDVLRSIETYAGGDAVDIITGVLSSNASNYLGEGGNDFLFGTSAGNTITGGSGADELDGNAGDDILDGKFGEGKTAVKDPLIDCGEGTNDLAIIDLLDDLTPTGCENISRSPAGEGPHVEMDFGRTVKVKRGEVAVRLQCPRKLRHRCAGTLALKIGRARTATTRYRIRPGRSKRVAVELGALAGSIGRRKIGELVSIEPSRVKRGADKITQRRIVLTAAG